VSCTGKLVEADWRRYPYLGTALDFVKAGTYSILTRALVLLAVTTKEEIGAFEQYNERCNPLRISAEQAAVFLYCFIDNDAEIIHRLFHVLVERNDDTFDERSAGDLVPQMIRQSVNSFRNALLPTEERERLGVLEKVAGRIEEWKGKPYTGSGSREEFVRVRLEPFGGSAASACSFRIRGRVALIMEFYRQISRCANPLLLPSQQSDFSRHRAWGFAYSCSYACQPRWVG
jgi:hypothetical protein